MKKRILALTLLFVLALLTGCQKEERKGDFRVGCWGDDKEAVKKYETENLLGDDTGSLVYETTVSNYNTFAIYNFDSTGKLYDGMYFLNLGQEPAVNHISIYAVLKNSLKQVYGEPDSDSVAGWDSAKEDEVTALQRGDSIYMTTWNTERSTIRLSMTLYQGDITTEIEYKDISHDETYNTDGL